MVRRLRSIARVAAFCGYLLFYGAAGALFAWMAGLFVGSWRDLKVGDVVWWVEVAIPIVGFLLGTMVAWHASRNTVAHASIMVIGAAQAVASGIYLETREVDLDNFLGDMILAGIAFWIGVTAAVAALGGVCGLAANALTVRAIKTSREPDSSARLA